MVREEAYKVVGHRGDAGGLAYGLTRSVLTHWNGRVLDAFPSAPLGVVWKKQSREELSG